MVALGSSTYSPGVALAATAELHEGGVARWVLRLHLEERTIVWTARPEQLVDDLFAMVGIHLLSFRDGVDNELLDSEVDNPHRDRSRSAVLDRAAAHCAQHGGTTIVSIDEGSTLGSQVRDFARLQDG
jgi:hypothetical protein